MRRAILLSQRLNRVYIRAEVVNWDFEARLHDLSPKPTKLTSTGVVPRRVAVMAIEVFVVGQNSLLGRGDPTY